MKLSLKRLLCLALACCLCMALLCILPAASAAAETEIRRVTIRIGPNGLTPGVWRPVSELYAACSSTGAKVTGYGWYTTGGSYISDKFGPEDCYLVVTLAPEDGYVFGETVDAYINNSGATCVRESETSIRVTSHVYTPIVFAATVHHHPQGETVDPGGWANFAAIGTYTQEQEWYLCYPDGKYSDLVEKVIDQASRADNLREDEYPVPKDFVTLKITGTDAQNLVLQNIPADMDGWQVFCRLWCYQKQSYTDTWRATITVNQPEPTPTPEPTPEPTPAPTVNPGLAMYDQIDLSSPAILGETEDMGQDYIDKIIFLGDSTTYGLRYYAMLSGGKDTLQVWTPASGTLALFNQSFATIVYPDDGTEIPIRDAVARKKPDMMVITLGVNGVSSMDHDDFLREYSSLVTDIMELSPNTKVIINSIYPVASHYNLLQHINNENICRANTWLVEVAEQTGTRFLNTISILMGSDGWLPYDYQNGDGLHLSPDAFQLVLDYIRTHGWT